MSIQLQNLSKPCHCNDTGCVPQEDVIYDVRLAHAYVPFQKYCGVYPMDRSLKQGTVFSELDMPYKKIKK